MAESTSRIGGGNTSSASRGGLDGLLPSGGARTGGGGRVEPVAGINGATGVGAHKGRMPGPGFSAEQADRTAPRGTYLDILV